MKPSASRHECSTNRPRELWMHNAQMGITYSQACNCGDKEHTIQDIIMECQKRKFCIILHKLIYNKFVN